jgi:hypothetical protein
MGQSQDTRPGTTLQDWPLHLSFQSLSSSSFCSGLAQKINLDDDNDDDNGGGVYLVYYGPMGTYILDPRDWTWSKVEIQKGCTAVLPSSLCCHSAVDLSPSRFILFGGQAGEGQKTGKTEDDPMNYSVQVVSLTRSFAL